MNKHNIIITNDMIKKLDIDINVIMNIIEDNIKNKNKFMLPPKTGITLPNECFYNTMPCIIPPYYSCKIVIRNTNNHPSLSGHIVLYNINNSKLLSTMDCEWITSIRTGIAVVTIN